MKYTQLIRLIFSNTDGTAKVNFTDVPFPVKSIKVSNAFYQSTIPAPTNPTVVLGIESNVTGHRQPLTVVSLNSPNCSSATTLTINPPLNIIGTKTFWVYNMTLGVFGSYNNTDTCSMIMEFNDS
jgi:hypothetical protein